MFTRFGQQNGTPHLVPNFGGTFFQMPITWAWNGVVRHFQGSDWHINILMLALFVLVVAVQTRKLRQGILANFATPLFKPP